MIHKTSRDIPGKSCILYYNVLHESLWLPLHVCLDIFSLLIAVLTSPSSANHMGLAFGLYVACCLCSEYSISSSMWCFPQLFRSEYNGHFLEEAFPVSLLSVALIVWMQSSLGIAQGHWWKTSLPHFMFPVVILVDQNLSCCEYLR